MYLLTCLARPLDPIGRSDRLGSHYDGVCKRLHFGARTPRDIPPSSLTRWRQRLGEAGLEALLAATIAAGQHSGAVRQSSLKNVIVDTTVLPKAVAHSTDSRLLERSRKHLAKAASECGIKLPPELQP